MVVLGSNSFFFDSTGRTCNVQPLTSDLGIEKNIPIVDGALAYDCPYSGKSYVLVIRNALYVPLTNHNLIPPFTLRASSITINDVPKIYCEDPVVNDHSTSFEHSDLRIPFQLNCVLSCLHKIAPTKGELHEYEKLFLTPDSSY